MPVIHGSRRFEPRYANHTNGAAASRPLTTRTTGSEKSGGRSNIVANNTRSATTTKAPKQIAARVNIGSAASFRRNPIRRSYGCHLMSAMGRRRPNRVDFRRSNHLLNSSDEIPSRHPFGGHRAVVCASGGRSLRAQPRRPEAQTPGHCPNNLCNGGRGCDHNGAIAESLMSAMGRKRTLGPELLAGRNRAMPYLHGDAAW